MGDNIFPTLGISLCLGLLVGLQRERSGSQTAGIRTFTLVSLLGTICGLIALKLGGLIIVGGFISLAAILVASNLLKLHQPEPERGQTTEVAALLMFAIGAFLPMGHPSPAIVTAGALALLLHLKGPMHTFVARMGDRDMKAVMQFVVISLVIFPLLPNRTYGPYAVLNPFDIWRMVVLIVGISLLGYVAYKLLGKTSGTVLGGILGGVISSTATTVSSSRRARAVPNLASQAALVIMIASTIAFARILVEIGLVAPRALLPLGLPLGAMFLIMILLSASLYFQKEKEHEEMPEPENPAELKSAIIFSALYSLITLGVAAAKHHFGSSALYVVAVISGLTDVDAITLSTARMVSDLRIDTTSAWRVILIASMANLAFKGATVAFLGNRRLTVKILVLFGLAELAGGAILWLWPASGWPLPRD